jgi:Protein of unknown function (DUF2934)
MENGTDHSPTPEEIALRAYEIYVSCGCPEGKDKEHWDQAEAELRKAHTPPVQSVVESLQSPSNA